MEICIVPIYARELGRKHDKEVIFPFFFSFIVTSLASSPSIGFVTFVSSLFFSFRLLLLLFVIFPLPIFWLLMLDSK